MRAGKKDDGALMYMEQVECVGTEGGGIDLETKHFAVKCPPEMEG